MVLSAPPMSDTPSRRTPRDDFSALVVRQLGARVGYRCSSPTCGRSTSGPSDEGEAKSTNVGEAAHITAAAPGTGARRYDDTLSTEARASIENGIWLCASCARMIDRDEERYSAEILRQWKRGAEERARRRIEHMSMEPLAARAGTLIDFDPSLATEFGAEALAEVELSAAALVAKIDERLTETVRQQSARMSLQAVAQVLRAGGRNADLVQFSEGSRNCPRAFAGLALPLLVLHVDHVVVVLDDALNGLYCFVLDASELDGTPLPGGSGWSRIDEPERAHRAVMPLIQAALIAGNMVAR
jgi:hypothetical protein